MAESSPRTYRFTCLECRQRKRACDKARPSCSRCQQNGRTCIYNDETTTSAVQDFGQLQAQVASLKRTVAYLTALPPASLGPRALDDANACELASDEDDVLRFMFFFDSATFLGRRCLYPTTNSKFAPATVDAFWDEYGSDVSPTLHQYFSTVHLWLPIISKIRLEQRMPTRAVDLKSGTALLLLCIKLVISKAPADEEGDTEALYNFARHCLMDFGPKILPSLEQLQAAILIAVFEVGHAMYPAAFLTVGYIVTLANTMGFDSYLTSPTMLRPPQNGAELEERKRTQWAVLLLDRFLILGGHGRPLQTREPSLKRLLPCNDAQFNAGEFAISSTIGAMQNSNIRQSSFARTCQVTHLLGSVKAHLDSQQADETYYGAEGMQLRRTINALCNVIQDELAQEVNSVSSGLWSSLGLCFSTLMMLYEAHCHTCEAWVATSQHSEMQIIALEDLRTTTKAIADYTERLQAAVEPSDAAEVSIFTCECIFSAASTCVWYIGENGELEASQTLEDLKSLLRVIERRWRIAGRMLELLSWQEKAFQK